MSLATLRLRGAPVTVLVYLTLLTGMLPARTARAEEPREEAPAQPGPREDAVHEAEPSTATVRVQSQTSASEEGARSAAVGAATPDSLPAGGADKTGVSSQSISVPQGTGKVQGMGESFSTQLSTGVATFTVPFHLLPARGGAQPSLSLSYSSGGGDGVAGVGWDVGAPFIARQTDRGLPRYQDPPVGGAWTPAQDRFVFNGGQELVPIGLVQGTTCTGALPGEAMPSWASGWQYFRPRVEGGFLRFFWSPDHRTWRVQAKTGVSMELGVPLDGSGYTGALETDPESAARVFRWDLVRQYDAYGGASPVNVVAYRYLQDGGTAYLSDVYDTPPSTTGPSLAALSSYEHHTRLTYETRTDPLTSFRRGWQTATSLRLTGVDVSSQTFGAGAGRQLVRRYHLAYDAGYHVSLLARVQMEGRCATTEGGSGEVSEDLSGALPPTSCPTLPAMTFGYQHVQGFDVGGASHPSDLAGHEPFDERVIPFTGSPPNSVDEQLTDLFDLDGDALPDVLVTNPAQFGGSLGAYLQGPSGQPNAFGPAIPMPVTGVPGEDATTITLQNLNVAALDIDGDGRVDLLHMPQVRTYSVYAPQGSGTNLSWVGRSVATASLQSPKLDFGSDAQNIHVLDVNGDGLVDLVRTSGTEVETFFGLGRYPTGDGQFGAAQWSGPASAQISNDPVVFCVPYAGLPVQFGDSSTKLADMNGDGLTDLVYTQQGKIQYWPGRGNGYFGTGDPAACPAGSFGQGTGVTMASSPWYPDPNGATLRLDDVDGDGLDDLVQIGFDTVSIWLNVDGRSWTPVHTIAGSPPAPSYADRVRLVDARGRGTRDLLWGDGNAYKYIDLQGGVRPWTLTHVENGLGKTTDIQYAASTDLMLAAAAAGHPWQSVMPVPAHVVTQVTDRDNMQIVGRPAGVYVTQYAYRDPVYDGRQREFRGFRSGTETHLGDVNSPTSVSSSTFLLGECRNDEGLSPDPCTEEGRWRDNPREALKGLPLVSETGDTAGTVLSTTHHGYRLRTLYTGLDGREVRYAFESQGDAWAYDTSPFTPSAQPVTVVDVEREPTPGAVQTDTTESVTLRAVAGRVHTHHGAAVDLFGNATSGTDDGCVDGCAAADESITTTTVPGLVPSCEVGGWMYRTIESYVTGTQTPGRRKDTFTQYDCGGSPVLTNAVLTGTLPLDRFHQDNAEVAPPPPAASHDGTILVGAQVYDGFGRLTQQTAPNGRCRQVTYDATYDELPVQEKVYVGTAAANAPCTGTPLSTVAQSDRGLGVVTRVTDLHGELTTASYDGFGRVTSVSKPDPVHVGATSSAASVVLQYFLPGDPTVTPYTIVHTQTQDGPDTATPAYHDTWAYADGLGRAIVGLDEADPSAGDGGQWVVNGLTSYDAKGAAQRAYLAWFWNGDPAHFPLGTVPSTPYGRQRYDAFGRQLQTFGLDGAITLQSAYHALSVDKWDAADLMPGPHQGTPGSSLSDGHGRTVAVTERIHTASGLEAHDTRTTYLASGEPVSVTRVRVGAADAPVTRTLVYDSLGRMVENVEPDTSTATRAWRYAYDDNGDLVGTSDARGCGANYFYDAGGRILAEDFSPCLSTQAEHSSPDLTTGDGTEAFYEYDALDADSANIPGFAIDPTLLLGRLVATMDRGAKTVTRFDGRGRTTGGARRIAAPGPPSDALATRYTPHWYTQTLAYDGADRPVQAGTGVDHDIPMLLDPGGQSSVTTSYTARGTVRSVSSGYGPLVTSVTHAADGPVQQITYGDVAGTTTTFGYDTRRRLSSVQTYRGPPALWSQPPASYLPPPAPGGLPTNFQLLLEDLDYVYDAVDNPVELRDFRNPVEWPAGSQPVTRKIQYDDLYRVTNVAYQYPSGTDSQVAPYMQETYEAWGYGPPFNPPDPRRAKVNPYGIYGYRVQAQSFQYDWLGNQTRTDDDQHAFYDRSLGAVTNGTAAQGPYQLRAATQTAVQNTGGALTAAYDDAGNLTSLAVHRNNECFPEYWLPCTQRYAYDWDEVGRLVRARRWDYLTSVAAATDPLPTATPSAELRYGYDASNARTLKTAVDAQGNQVHTVYVSGALELRRTTFDGTDYARNVTTEVGFLVAHGVRLARLQYAVLPEPTVSRGQLHLLMELPDHLGSTSLVVDHDTSELVEATSYLAYGARESDYRSDRWADFREDYGFTGKEEDTEVGLLYFGQRYLSAALGRWASADPLTVHGLGADANAYAYVHGRLLSATDPVGLTDDRTSNEGGRDQGLADAVHGMLQNSDVNNSGLVPDLTPADPGCTMCANQTPRAATPAPAPAPLVTSLNEGPVAPAPPSTAPVVGVDHNPSPPSGRSKTDIGPTLGSMEADGIPLTSVQQTELRLYRRRQLHESFEAAAPLMLSLATGLAGTAVTMDLVAEDATISAADDPMVCPCFSGDTEVQTAAGAKPISQVHEGELLWSADPETGERALRRVTRRFVTPERSLVEVEVEDANGAKEVIRATPGHPFWVTGVGWMHASDLATGQALWTSSGEQVHVVSGRSQSATETVYNFDVEGWHTYFVGNADVLVHNGCNDCDPAWQTADPDAAYDRTVFEDPSYKTTGQHWLGQTCQYCQSAPATSIDHIVPIRVGRDLVYMDMAETAQVRGWLAQSDNLLGACTACNSAKWAHIAGNTPGTWLPPNPSAEAIQAMTRMGTWQF